MKLSTIKSAARDGAVIALISLLGLALMVVVVDVTAYTVLGIRAPGEGPARFFVHDSQLGRFHRPGASGDWHRYRDGTRFPVRINRHGFSDDPREVAKRKPRIALIGDSTAQFWEAPLDRRGHRLLARKLAPDWEVLNFGVRGYGLDQSLLLYRRKIRAFRPDIAVIHVCVNDVWDHATRVDKPYFVVDEQDPDGIRLAGVPVPKRAAAVRKGGRWFLWRHSYFLRRLGVIRHPDLKRSYPLDEHFELRPYKREYNEEDDRWVTLTGRILGRLVAELRADGVHVLIVEMPYKPVLSEAGRRRIRKMYGDVFEFERWPSMLQEMAAAQGVPFVSMSEVISDHGREAASLFHPEDQLHMNAAGQALYAEAVVARLERLGWLTGSDHP